MQLKWRETSYHFVLFCFALSSYVLFTSALSCTALFCSTLFCSTLFFFALLCQSSRQTLNRLKSKINIWNQVVSLKSVCPILSLITIMFETQKSVYGLKNLCQQMHIKRDISIWNIKILLSVLIVIRDR